MEKLQLENESLKKKIKLYEISTKLDYEKIEKLKFNIEQLNKQILKLKN